MKREKFIKELKQEGEMMSGVPSQFKGMTNKTIKPDTVEELAYSITLQGCEYDELQELLTESLSQAKQQYFQEVKDDLENSTWAKAFEAMIREEERERLLKEPLELFRGNRIVLSQEEKDTLLNAIDITNNTPEE